MKLPIICRTCDAKDTDKLYKLAAATKRFPDKLLSEILTELTHIEVMFVKIYFGIIFKNRICRTGGRIIGPAAATMFVRCLCKETYWRLLLCEASTSCQ